MKTLLYLLIAITLCKLAATLDDNGIVGDPYVSCGPNSIDIRLDTQNTFKGVAFVLNHLDDPECRSTPIDQTQNNLDTRNTQIRLNFRSCGLERKRNINPKGLFLSTSLVIAFHPEFLTKFDRIYNIKCFYMEAEAQCGKKIMVNMPPPTLQTDQVPMPVCKYEVLEGGPDGPPVYFTTVGQMVYHKWTCDTNQSGYFCMTVHSCTVDDGNGDRVELIDNKGCAHDKFLLQNLDYVSDLIVGKEAHVYKYADRSSMYFDCNITLNVKNPSSQYCDVPNCPDPPRRRRSLENKFINTMEKLKIKSKDDPVNIDNVVTNLIDDIDLLCLSNIGLSSIAAFNIVILTLSGLILRNAFKSA